MQPFSDYGFLDLARDLEAGTVRLLNDGLPLGHDGAGQFVAVGVCRNTPGVYYLAGYARGGPVVAATVISRTRDRAAAMDLLARRTRSKCDALLRSLEDGKPVSWFCLVHPDDCRELLAFVQTLPEVRQPVPMGAQAH